MPDYKRLEPQDDLYQHVKSAIERGGWACDAVDHNESDGCSNPSCFKFREHGGQNHE